MNRGITFGRQTRRALEDFEVLFENGTKCTVHLPQGDTDLPQPKWATKISYSLEDILAGEDKVLEVEQRQGAGEDEL